MRAIHGVILFLGCLVALEGALLSANETARWSQLYALLKVGDDNGPLADPENLKRFNALYREDRSRLPCVVSGTGILIAGLAMAALKVRPRAPG